MEKGENACYQHFLFSCNIFKSFLFQGHKKLGLCGIELNVISAKPRSSVGIVQDLRTGGHWFNPQLSGYSFRELMIVIATRFIPLSLLSIVLTMVM